MGALVQTTRARVADLRARNALRELRIVRKAMRRFGYHVVRANYYSPIPDLAAIPSRVWVEPDAMPGLDWDLDAQLSFIETELRSSMHELDVPLDQPGTETGLYLRNPFFPSLDIEILYAMIRHFRPRNIIELGAGYSTLVIAAAAQLNNTDGAPVRHMVYDPYPPPGLGPIQDRIELQAISATDIPSQRFAMLSPGDILFIDTTHTVKPAGDVTHLILSTLPRLAPGVIVHIHDFFRPFEYPYALMNVFGNYWQEHYLVQGFLAFNPDFEILCANHALRRLHPHRVESLVRRWDDHAEPSSIWLRRRNPAQDARQAR